MRKKVFSRRDEASRERYCGTSWRTDSGVGEGGRAVEGSKDRVEEAAAAPSDKKLVRCDRSAAKPVSAERLADNGFESPSDRPWKCPVPRAFPADAELCEGGDVCAFASLD
jgi:hypothetical protein